MIYLDTNATAIMKPAVRAAMFEAMERHGNASSVHRYGRIARRYVEDARAAVAAFVGVKPVQVIFTSGATEANNFILATNAHCVCSTIEHPSVLGRVPIQNRLSVRGDGVIDLPSAAARLREAPRGTLVSLMLVNNETGIVQPVAALAETAKAFGHFIHTDAVQAAGRLPIDFASLGVDALSLSAHKFGGPQGMGALVVREGFALEAFLMGGGQEQNRRAGTENVAGIVGFGVAAQLAVDDLRDMPRVSSLRDRLQHQLEAIAGTDAVVIGKTAARVANTLCVALKNVSAETQVASMDLSGVAVSSGSACSSGKVKTSHVLTAMGYSSDVSSSAVRISLGWQTQTQDVDRCVEAWSEIYRRTQPSQKTKAA